MPVPALVTGTDCGHMPKRESEVSLSEPIARSGKDLAIVSSLNEDFRRKGVAIGVDRLAGRRLTSVESLRVFYADPETGVTGVLGLAYALAAWLTSTRGVGASAVAKAICA